jgi:hypothetical protein
LFFRETSGSVRRYSVRAGNGSDGIRKTSAGCLRSFWDVRRERVDVVACPTQIIRKRIDRRDDAIDNGTVDFGENRDLHRTLCITRIPERIVIFAFLRLNSDSSSGTLAANSRELARVYRI